MKISYKSINCGHENHNYCKYVEFAFSKNAEELQTVKHRTNKLIEKLNPRHLGSNRIRTEEEMIGDITRGALAEICSKKLFQEVIEKRNLNARIDDTAGLNYTSESGTQIDLHLIVNGKKSEIEIKSSCVRNGTDFGIKSGYFNIVGWFVHNAKKFDPPKNFYMMYLFPFDAEKTMSIIEDDFILHFVGGATKNMLEGPLGRYTDLKQYGMKCCGIKPICAGLDSLQMIEKMLTNE